MDDLLDIYGMPELLSPDFEDERFSMESLSHFKDGLNEHRLHELVSSQWDDA